MGLVVLIICINIVYVSFNTLRVIFVIKGKRLLASFLSMVEVGIYLIGLSIVLQNLDSPLKIVAYCLGYGAGVFIGSRIEQALALGYVSVEVIVDGDDASLPALLRERGFGVTAWNAQGRDGSRLVLHVLAKRTHEKDLIAILNDLAPNAFVISHEPKYLVGGFLARHIGG